MIISYQGAQSFKVQFGDITIAFDPISKKSSFRANNFGADIALISVNHPDMNGVDQVSRGDKQAFIIKSPGEYEIQGVFVKGLPSTSFYGVDSDNKESGRINTIYTVDLENMNLCFLGALGSTELPKETKTNIDGIDILFVPIGGRGTLDPAEAYKFAVSLEPSIIIPMNYDDKSLKAFIKEAGEDSIKSIERLTIKKKDLEGKGGEVVILSEQ